MSSIIKAQVSIANDDLLTKALNDLNLSCTKNGSEVKVPAKYADISFDLKNGNVRYDSMDEDVLVRIKNHYAKHEMLDILTNLGINGEVVEIDDKIEIRASL